jgi:hypothetical protein
MDRILRIKKLSELGNSNNPYSYKELTYKKTKSKLPVYEIPVEYLIFNQYNGRIGTYVKTYEKQYGPIDAETLEGEKIIVDFLWKSKENRNKETQIDIEKNGQLEYGIVTKDGIVIDGNRRCMLLKKIALEKHDTPTYFKAVILDDSFSDNAKEIRKLETIYQMGVDEKVDYNAIEKYLKCKDLSGDFTNDEIGKMMGEKPSKIKEYLAILKLMEEYLNRYGYDGMYTRLNEETVEGPFVDVRGYLEKQTSGKGVRNRDWEPNPEDVADLRDIYFDHIRAGFRTAHGIRDIGNPSKGNGFFNHEKIWNEFSDNYFSEVGSKINDKEPSLDELRKDSPSEEVEKIIAARDNDWTNNVKDTMKKNFGITKRKLDDFNENNFPYELLLRALNTLKAINTDIDAFDESILNTVREINSLTWDFQQIIKKKSKE